MEWNGVDDGVVRLEISAVHTVEGTKNIILIPPDSDIQ